MTPRCDVCSPLQFLDQSALSEFIRLSDSVRQPETLGAAPPIELVDLARPTDS